MKKILCLLLIFFCAWEHSFSQFTYISPQPGTGLHNPDCSIIFREGSIIDSSVVKDHGIFSVTGLQSGKHEVRCILSDDKKTIILKPLVPFAEGEKVMVTIRDGIRKLNGGIIKGCNFSFDIIPPRTPEQSLQIAAAKKRILEEEFGKPLATTDNTREGEGMPKFSIDVNVNPAPGMIFYHNWRVLPNQPGNMFTCIMSSEGDSVYSSDGAHKGLAFDLNRNGYLTLFNVDSSYFEMWDSSYNLIDVFKAANGYIANSHEFVVLPNNHSFILIYDPQIIDMTVYNPNYNPFATVIGAIIQELDSGKNVIFEWRSWDHLEITDALHADLSALVIDYVHANAIEVDTDDNLLVSCRIFDQILKIDRNTGDIIWRLGGTKNEFTFVNDPDRFNHQHDIRRIPNGHITLFDNGSYHTPPQTFVKEYELDEVNKIATLTWSYSYPPSGTSLISYAMGNAQRLLNGHTLINWGEPTYNGTPPNITEVDSDGVIVWQMHFTDSVQYEIYRAHRYEWNPCARPTGNLMYTTDVTVSSAKIGWSAATGAWEYLVAYHQAGSAVWDSATVPASITSYELNNLLPFTTYEWKIKTICEEGGTSSGYSIVQNFITESTWVDSVAQGILFSVYPNPVRDELHLHVKMDHPVDLEVELFNLLGQVMYKKWLGSTDDESVFTLSIGALSAGMYFLRMNAGDYHPLQKIMVE